MVASPISPCNQLSSYDIISPVIGGEAAPRTGFPVTPGAADSPSVRGVTAVGELRVVAAGEVPEGAGARVRRLMPSPELPHLDPFVLFDHATVEPPAGFPAHPHRGFEIVTYMLEGAFAHWDDAGHEEIVSAGGSQRITAGRGIVHSEMPAGHGPARGLQLWVNLPRALKDLPPDYQTVPASALPEEARDGARVRHVVGGGSPVALRTAVSYRDVRLAGSFPWRVPAGWSGFAYVVEGAILEEGSGARVPAGHALVFHGFPEERELVLRPAGGAPGPSAARAALVCARPHGEPIRLWGPYVL